MQRKLDGVCFKEISMKNDQIRSLTWLQDGVKVDNDKVQINPLVLFGWLTIFAQRQEDMKAQFHFELTPELSSLFKDGLVRNPTKSTLWTHLTRNAVTPKTPSKNFVTVGETLMFKVQWLRNLSYCNLGNRYVNHLKTKHMNFDIHVVFDGYSDPLSTKAHEHLWRGAILSADKHNK